MGIPFARWGAKPFIVHPIPCPPDCRETIQSHGKTKTKAAPCVTNSVLTALQWQRMLASDQARNMAEIAEIAGISRARVTQIMNLLGLPKQILTHVAAMSAHHQLRVFSERALRRILALPAATDQFAAFSMLRQRAASEP